MIVARQGVRGDADDHGAVVADAGEADVGVLGDQRLFGDLIDAEVGLMV